MLFGSENRHEIYIRFFTCPVEPNVVPDGWFHYLSPLYEIYALIMLGSVVRAHP
jgi:hypothetical protein